MDSTTEHRPGEGMVGRQVTPEERRRYLDSLLPVLRAQALAYMIADPTSELCKSDNTFVHPVNQTIRILLDCGENPTKTYASLLLKHHLTRTQGRGKAAKTWIVLNSEQRSELDALLAEVQGTVTTADVTQDRDTKLLGELDGILKTEEAGFSTAGFLKLLAVLPLGAQLQEMLADQELLKVFVGMIEKHQDAMTAVMEFIRAMLWEYGTEKTQSIMQLLVQIVNAQKD